MEIPVTEKKHNTVRAIVTGWHTKIRVIFPRKRASEDFVPGLGPCVAPAGGKHEERAAQQTQGSRPGGSRAARAASIASKAQYDVQCSSQMNRQDIAA
mmetsp:Transcript_43623/g.98276  ORF Transcript_43623/g.98276 Transcript_43623/m.98276 type:complete len:98 (+) Transcript_43623:239-532(+)